MKLRSFSYGSQFIDQKDIQEVANSLKGKFITNGPYVKKFEDLCKKKNKSKICVHMQ